MASIDPEQDDVAPDASSSVIATPVIHDLPVASSGDEVVLYQLNHRSSKYNIFQDGPNSPTQILTSNEVSTELAAISNQPTKIGEIVKTFHSARPDKLRLSVHDLHAQV
jgi:hypothetical protein